MSTIDKLGISGLRSYSSERNEVIEFLKPVTLIVGPNGSGKTTIIEALRYCIAGVLPPLSENGKTFVRDPRLNGANEVKAVVKLKFRAINEKPVLCIRNMQISYVNQHEEIKKTEQFLKIKHVSGDVVNIAHTCSEIDKQMPELLGISKCVLEHVVLCHQEESMWPFADGHTLKRVFDELFDTARLAKFSEQISSGLRAKVRSLKEERNIMELAKSDYERYISLKGEFGFALGRAIEVRNEIQLLEDKLSEDQDLVSLSSLQRAIGSCDLQLGQHKTRYKEIEALISNFKNWSADVISSLVFAPDFSQKVIESPDVFLNYVGNLKAKEKELNGLDHGSNGRCLEDSQVPKNPSAGSGASINPGHADPEKAIKGQLAHVDNNHAYSNELIELALSVVEDSLFKAKELISSTTSELETVIENMRANDTKALVQEVKFLVEKLLNKKIEDYEVTNESYLSNLLELLEDSKVSVEAEYQRILLSLGKANESHHEEARKLQQKQKALEAKLGDFKIKETINEQKLLQQKLKEEHQDLEANKVLKEVMFHQNMETLDKISMIRKEIHLVRKTISNKKYREYSWQKERIFKRLNFDCAETKTNDEIARIITEAEAHLRTTDEKKAEIKAAISLETSNKRKREAECDYFAKSLEEFKLKFKKLNLRLEFSQPYDFYKGLKEKVSNQRTKVTLLRYALDDFLPKTLKDSIKSSRCFLCDRPLHTENTVNLERGLQNRIEKSKRSILENEGELQYEHARFEQLQQHRKDIKEFQRYSDQFKECSNEVNQMSIKICDFVYEQKKLEEESRVLNERLADLRDLQNTMILIEAIDSVDIEQDFVCQPERDQAELLKLQEEEISLCQKLSSDQFSLKEIDLKITSAQERIYFLNQQLAFIRGADIIITDIFDDAQTFSTREEVMAAVALCKSEIQELPFRFEQLKMQLNAEKENVDKNLYSIKSCIEKVQTIKNIVANNSFPQIKKQLEGQLIELLKSDEVLSKFKKFLSLCLEKVTVGAKVAIFASDRESLEKEEKRLNNKKKIFDELNKKLNEKRGQELALQSSLDEIFDKLEKLQVTEQIYAQKFSQCEYTRLLIEDLELVHKSLESALIEYHTQKIAEINKIIHNIWKVAYTGADIETIKILSRANNLEDSQLKASGQNKKNYDYKVVFYNADHKQLAMSGRTSVGQRMLASIVIRLALSEAFCVSSGLLALDEPTTNLDEENTKMLAQFLKRLIKAREKQKSFQLIVITHDHDFVSMIGSNSKYYYRVSKDGQGYSKIEKAQFSNGSTKDNY